MTKQVSDPDSLQFVLEHAASLRAQFAELDEDAIIETDGRDVVLLADEVERLQHVIKNVAAWIEGFHPGPYSPVLAAMLCAAKEIELPSEDGIRGPCLLCRRPF